MKANHVRQATSILLVLSLLLAGILAVSCKTSSPSQPFDESSPSSELTVAPITPEPSGDTITEPPSTTVTVTDDPLSQDIDDYKNQFLPPNVAGTSIPFAARMLRTPPTTGTVGISTNPVILHNGEELSDYLAEAQYGWQFSDEDMDELHADYDHEFFRESVLIVGAIGLNSGSIQVGIKDIIKDAERLTVLYDFVFPEVGTCDMMSWHYFIGISADDAAGRTIAESYLPNIESPTIVR